MKNFNYLKDTDYIKDNLLFNYCLWDDNAHVIEHFIHNNHIQLNFDLDEYYFAITGIHKNHSKYDGSSGLSRSIEDALQVLASIESILLTYHYKGNAFLIKVDNSKQIGIIFSKQDSAQLSSLVMLNIIYQQIIDPFFINSRFVSTSLSNAYSGYEGIHEAFNEARNLNQLSFFTEEFPIFTQEYLKLHTIDCGLISMNSSITKLRYALSFEDLQQSLNELHLIIYDLIQKSLNYRYFLSFFINIETIFEMFNEIYHLKLPIKKDHHQFYKLTDYTLYVDYLIRLYYQQVSNHQRYSPDIINILSYVHTNYATNLTLKNIGDFLNVNTTYISSKFNQEVGCSFPEYLHQQRIFHAKQSLEHTTLKIQDIALNVGYSSAKYFSDIFIKLCNMTPNEYRKHIKKN